MSAVDLWKPDTLCPMCGRPPRLAFTREQLEKWSTDHPSALVQTYQCSFEKRNGRKCNTVFRIRAGDLHRARKRDADAKVWG